LRLNNFCLPQKAGQILIQIGDCPKLKWVLIVGQGNQPTNDLLMTRKTIRNQLTVVAAVRGSKFEWANATRTKLDVPEIAKEAAIMVEAAVFQQLLADESVAAQVMEIFEPED
jgi:hypothetical protein